MRKLKRNKNNKQVHAVLGGALSLLFVMTIGYAAFSSSIGISAKGNVVGGFSISEIVKNTVSTGDGLYDDGDGSYTYKGANPNNYITFNASKDGQAGWRILSFEADGTVKIIKNLPFGETDYWEDDSSNPVWSTSLACDLLNSQTNNSFYNSGLSTEAKNLIVSHAFNVGAVENQSDLSAVKTAEAATTWSGYVGLMTLSDFLQINTDTTNCGSINAYNQNHQTCYSANYIINNLWSVGDSYFTTWFMTPASSSGSPFAWVLDSDTHLDSPQFMMEPIDDYYGSFVPVLYLKSSLNFKGSGTLSNPYTIME